MDSKIPFFNKTIADMFLDNVIRRGNKMAYQYDNVFWSWNEIHIASEIMADELITLGVKPGMKVGIWSPNSINYVIAFLAIQKVRAISVLLNTNYRAEELEDTIKIANIEYICYGACPSIVNDEDLLKRFKLEASNPLKNILSISDDNNYLLRMKEYAFLDFEYVSNQCDSEKEVACVLFTSGSTLKPKAVQLTHFNVINTAYESALAYDLSEKDSICMALPLFHCFGIVFCILSAMITGAVIHITKSTRTAEILQVIDSYKCTIFHSVPTLMLAIINNRSFSEYATEQIRTSVIAGAPIVPVQLKKMVDAFPNNHFMNAFGQTESSPTISITNYEDTFEHVCETIGKPLDRVDVRICSMTDGHFLEQGEVGEIVAKGYNIMKGYIGLPDELQAVDDEGWLHTGDLGLIDEEGYIRLKGRAKELIIRGGENISPIEVENAICEYEDVLSCKVVGAPHDFFGEEVVACIELKKRNKYSEEELKLHLSKRIAEYKIPSRIIIYDELPMTANGKIDAKLLKEQVKER